MQEYGFIWQDILPYKDKMVDSVLPWENTGQWKPSFLHIYAGEEINTSTA